MKTAGKLTWHVGQTAESLRTVTVKLAAVAQAFSEHLGPDDNYYEGLLSILDDQVDLLKRITQDTFDLCGLKGEDPFLALRVAKLAAARAVKGGAA